MLSVLRGNRTERKARRVARMLLELDARSGAGRRQKPARRGAACVSLGQV
jgi:hypothetical protein